MSRPLTRRDYESIRPRRDSKVEELETRVAELERKLEMIITMKKPSFMDFQFIKEEESEKQDERKVITMMRAMSNIMR